MSLTAASTTQTRILTSDAEAELAEIYRTSKTIIQSRGLSSFFPTVTQVKPTILSDSQIAIITINNPISTHFRYLAIYSQFVKELPSTLKLEVIHIARENNIAELMTKPGEFFMFGFKDNLAEPQAGQ